MNVKRLVPYLVTGFLLASSPQLYAPDGTYLGNLNANPYDPNSVSNPYGKYGSPFSPYSIHNPYGKYGSPYSPDSANNPYTTGGPRIVVPRGSGGTGFSSPVER
ncbi:hypothetical protein [Leptospirillum ferriphilum]|uniref:hypothetical protein n=1 Tax=Leptospirillum ferriphilum TaxID=178606 RepID=UPI001939CDE3|nr:hypothetical protein [Leptospirillum ferriphilum]